MNTTSIGQQAETAAAQSLEVQDYKILQRNWRTRWCEIDIVASRYKRVYFIEVKYRKNAEQGTGLDYITAKKLKQMKFAAELWVSENQWRGDYSLGAMEVTGLDFRVSELVSGFI